MAEEKINERLLEIYKNINSAHFEVKNIENACLSRGAFPCRTT